MINEKNDKEPANKNQVTREEDLYHYSETGVYLRDDHCDWGSGGMNEYTKEYSLHSISDDK